MAGTTIFFNPTDPLAIAGEWLIQDCAKSKSKERAQGLDQYGDETAWKEHGAKESVTAVYECQSLDGTLTIPDAGQVTAGGYHIDSVTVEYSNAGWPKMTVAAHRHTGATGTHATGGCRTYTAGLSLPAMLGVPSSVAGQFATASAGTALRSLSYSLSVQHVDEPGAEGEWFAGENRDGTETLNIGFIGKLEDSAVIAAEGWGTPSDSAKDANTSVGSRTLSLVRHIKKD